MLRTIPRDTDPYPYHSSQSCSILNQSSSSILQIPPFVQPSEVHTSDPMIHLESSLHLNLQHLSFPSATEQQHFPDEGSMLTQDPRYLRCQTQWHPPFNVMQGPPPSQFLAPTSNHAPPSPSLHQQSQNSTGHRSPNSTLTSDPFVQMFQLINKSNTKMHNAILKQQESIAKQQQAFTDFLQTESTLQKEQTTLVQKQLDALIALAPAKVQVPPTHFQPNSVDGISFDSIAHQQDPRPTSNQQSTSAPIPVTSNQELPSKIPARIKSETQLPTDDSSVASVQSVLQGGYQDIKINFSTFEEAWLQNNAPKACMWYGNIISKLASKSYYHPLLSLDKKHINFNAPIEGQNVMLHSVLQTKLSSQF